MEHRKLVEELHKPNRKNYRRRKFDVRGINETWQADLVEMQPYARENKGIKFMLTVIDIFSKYAWAVPIKRKTAEDVSAAMASILRSVKSPKNLHTDAGKEFYNSRFKKLMVQYKINHYSTYSNMKASICERFNRTLKAKMWKHFSLKGSYKWLDILPSLMMQYNNSKHRTIGMKPIDVNSSNQNAVFKRIYGKGGARYVKPKLGIGDKVRVSKAKHVFEKGYTPNWTTEIFTVNKVSKTNPVTYNLVDYKDQPILGGFYEEELLKAKYPDIYLVEKVIKKRGDRMFVKWLGFDDSHNSWINKNDV